MFDYDPNSSRLSGPAGSLPIPSGDEASLKMAMLLQGECSEIGPTQAAKNFGYSKSRYYQIRDAFAKKGMAALVNKKTGPKRNYRRTPEVTKLVIRARFLDHEASIDVIASKLRQDGYKIATRSVERIVQEYGLQKKTPYTFPPAGPAAHRDPTDKDDPSDSNL
jgi:transposase